MPFDDLRQWIAALDRAGEMKRIQTEVDPILEIAEITDRSEQSKTGKPGGPALLFQNVKQHPGSQVLINQFGSEARMKLALGVNSFEEFADRIRVFMDLKSPQGFLDKLKMLPLLTEAGKFFPKTVPTGPCKEVIKRDNFSLLDFPILQCWPEDAGRFITLPCVVTRDPNRASEMSACTVSRSTTAKPQAPIGSDRRSPPNMLANACAPPRRIMWRRPPRPSGRGKARPPPEHTPPAPQSISWHGLLAAKFWQTGNHPSGKMEVAVAIGTDPAVTFSAIVPAPPDVEEYLIAGFLRAAPVELVKCETVDLEVPATSESFSKATSTSTNFAVKALSAITPAFIP